MESLQTMKKLNPNTNSLVNARTVLKTLTVLALFSLVACAGNKQTITSDQLPTMKELYHQKYGIKNNERVSATRSIHSGKDDWNPETHSTLKNLNQAFRYLPNPLLTMYIFPHLTEAGTPVPGYTTFFKFYETDQIGLPGEFAPKDSLFKTTVNKEQQQHQQKKYQQKKYQQKKHQGGQQH